ncbi:MAG: hypothetical protein Q4G48_06090 [Bacteroidia bacterium]|nr:hypothetical protein [Bacteroidia bacterium]
MEDLKIIYTLSQRIKIPALIAGGFLFALSVGLSIFQALQDTFDFFFFVGIAGAVIGLLLILTVTIWQSNLIIEIDNDEFRMKLPNQRINGSIFWESVTQLGIGLSYLTLTTTGTNYKVDLGNLKYNDIKKIKAKLIEVCEAKSIPYSNG